MQKLVAGLSLFLVAACGPVGSPASNPDHGPPKPPNGIIIDPVRPANIPDDFLFMSWHVLALDEDWEEGPHVPVRIRINAASPNAPVQGNVHGGYPFDVYTYTPYTHTIWYAPGVEIVTDIQAVADPGLPTEAPLSLVCTASSSHHVYEEVRESETFQVNDYCRAVWTTEANED